jgi:hypothetical protein
MFCPAVLLFLCDVMFFLFSMTHESALLDFVTGVHPEFSQVGGGWTDSLYNLCLILKMML